MIIVNTVSLTNFEKVSVNILNYVTERGLDLWWQQFIEAFQI